jgi:hypothetical protein
MSCTNVAIDVATGGGGGGGDETKTATIRSDEKKTKKEKTPKRKRTSVPKIPRSWQRYRRPKKKTTSIQIVEPTIEIVEPTIEIVEPTIEIVEPTIEIVEPTIEIVEPAVQIVEPTIQIVEPTPTSTTTLSLSSKEEAITAASSPLDSNNDEKVSDADHRHVDSADEPIDDNHVRDWRNGVKRKRFDPQVGQDIGHWSSVDRRFITAPLLLAGLPEHDTLLYAEGGHETRRYAREHRTLSEQLMSPSSGQLMSSSSGQLMSSSYTTSSSSSSSSSLSSASIHTVTTSMKTSSVSSHHVRQTESVCQERRMTARSASPNTRGETAWTIQQDIPDDVPSSDHAPPPISRKVDNDGSITAITATAEATSATMTPSDCVLQSVVPTPEPQTQEPQTVLAFAPEPQTVAPMDMALGDVREKRSDTRSTEGSVLTRILKRVLGIPITFETPLTFPSSSSTSPSSSSTSSSSRPTTLTVVPYVPFPSIFTTSADPCPPHSLASSATSAQTSKSTVMLPPFSTLSFTLPSALRSPSPSPSLSLSPLVSPISEASSLQFEASSSQPDTSASPTAANVPQSSPRHISDSNDDSYSDAFRDLLNDLVTPAPLLRDTVLSDNASPSSEAHTTSSHATIPEVSLRAPTEVVVLKEAGDTTTLVTGLVWQDANKPASPFNRHVPSDINSQGNSQEVPLDASTCIGCRDASRDADFVCRLCGMGRCPNCGGNWDQHTQCLWCAAPHRN